MAIDKGEAISTAEDTERRLWDLVLKFRDSGLVDLSGLKDSPNTWLHEFEKHQDLLEADNGTPSDTMTTGTLTVDERQVLTGLRRTFPSQEDRIWQHRQVTD